MRPLDLPDLLLLRDRNDEDEVPAIANGLEGLLLANRGGGFGFGVVVVVVEEALGLLLLGGGHLQSISSQQTGGQAAIVGDIAQTRLPSSLAREHPLTASL